MKNLILVLLIAAAAYFGYLKYFKPAEPPPDEDAAESAEAQPAAEKPAQMPSNQTARSTPPPAPAPKRFAPEGTFFLLKRVSVPTDAGIVGILPGTKVSLVKELGADCRVTDGVREFAVARTQLTNDIDLAEQIGQADREAHAKVTEALAAKAREIQQRQSQLAVQQTPSQAEQRPPAPTAQAPVASNSPVRNNPLEKGAYNSNKDKKYVDEYGRVYWRDVFGRRHYD